MENNRNHKFAETLVEQLLKQFVRTIKVEKHLS